MTPKHVAASMAALNLAGTVAAAPIVAGAGSVGLPKTEHDANLAAARKAGAEAERTRIGAILNHEAAAGRGKLAAHLAFKTDLSVEDAGKMLAASATYAGATFTNGGRVEVLHWGDIVSELNATLPGAQVEESTR